MNEKKTKRIGIVSYNIHYKYSNYGSVLQSYAMHYRKGGDFDENTQAGQGRRNRYRREAAWRGRRQAPHHGHGHHEGRAGLRPQGRAAGRPGRGQCPWL